MRPRRTRPSIIGIGLRLGAAAALGAAARTRFAERDEEARELIARSRRDGLDTAMPVLTDLGSVYALAGATATLLVAGRRRSAIRLAIAGGLAWSATQGMKPFYRRNRPYQDGVADRLVRTPAGSSYPSGHPAVAMAMSRVLADDTGPFARRTLARVPRFVAFSRVYNGVHYPTDVIGGLLVGRAAADATIRFLGRGPG